MSRINFGVFTARFADLLAEARGELDEDEFDDLIVLIVNACSVHIANRIEERHYYGGDDG